MHPLLRAGVCPQQLRAALRRRAFEHSKLYIETEETDGLGNVGDMAKCNKVRK